MLGSFVVLYLFLGGCGAGVLLTASLWSLLFYGTRTRTFEQSRAFGALAGKLYAGGFLLLAAAALCLLLDLGRPQRFLLLFVRPTPSLLSVGSFVLLASLLCAGVLAAIHFAAILRAPSAVRKGLEGACTVLATALMVYTGLYMAWMEAVPLWNNAALPVLLALSSASSGLAAVLLTAPFSRDWPLLGGWADALHRVHCLVLALEAAALVAFVGLAALSPFARPSLGLLLAPEGLGAWFIGGFAIAAVALPLVAEVARGVTRTAAPLLASEVLCVLGGLILRFCLVLAGSHWRG